MVDWLVSRRAISGRPSEDPEMVRMTSEGYAALQQELEDEPTLSQEDQLRITSALAITAMDLYGLPDSLKSAWQVIAGGG